MNYKAIDTRRIIDYIYSFPGSVIGVEDIIQNAGPALFELEQAGYIEVVEREELGVPLAVRRRRDASQVLHDSM